MPAFSARLMKLMPTTLFGRLVLILVLGTLAAQALTSSIWYDVRHSQILEIPTRLIASRIADITRAAAADPSRADLLVAALDAPDFHLSLQPAPSSPRPVLDSADKATERLLDAVIEEKSGVVTHLHLLNLEVLDEEGHRAGVGTLFGSSAAAGQFTLELDLLDGRWLRVEARESQGWTSLAPMQVMLEYFLRIYLLRILLVVAIALWAVHLAIRPINRLAAAAQALGQDIRRPPLALAGPVEVRRAAEAFNRMQQRLIDNLGERTRFLAAVSHDLRSPITRLRLRTEMLTDEPLKTRFRQDLEAMESMVAATLTFVSSGEMDQRRLPIDLNALLVSLQTDLLDLGEQVAIHGHAERPVNGYAQSLRRCVGNLLENAVRYGTDVEMVVHEDAQGCEVVVRDRGPGIPDALLERVLEPFYRLDPSRNSQTGGYGLGLSIAHTVALAHGGSLTLRNREGGGLQATLHLPR